MSSPISRRIIPSIARTVAPSSSGFGSRTWRRLNASSWRVSSAARCAARSICSTSRALRLSRGSALREDRAVAEDHGEQVVEVVRDAAGEPAERLHLLRLAQLALEALGLAQIVLHRREPERLAVRVAQQERADLRRDQLAGLLVAQHAFALPAAVLADDRRRACRPSLGVKVGERHRADVVVRRNPDERAAGGVDEQRRARRSPPSRSCRCCSRSARRTSSPAPRRAARWSSSRCSDSNSCAFAIAIAA